VEELVIVGSQCLAGLGLGSSQASKRRDARSSGRPVAAAASRAVSAERSARGHHAGPVQVIGAGGDQLAELLGREAGLGQPSGICRDSAGVGR
jgi:hypothetical protein